MKKLSILTLTMIALLGFMATNAHGQNPHFLRCATNGVNSDGTLDVSFAIAGLGSDVTIDVTASAHADATYACRNHGQQCPNAANKVHVTGDVSMTGTFTSGKNGSIRASLTVEPPPSTLTCPGGQRLVLVEVTYTNVSVSAAEAGDCIPDPGTFSANFFPNCP